MKRECDKIRNGSVLTNFELISYDEDTGRLMARKTFADGSEWLEPVALTIPDLFYLFKVEGVDPAEMVGETNFEFHKARLEIGCLVQAPCDEEDEEFGACADAHYEVWALRK